MGEILAETLLFTILNFIGGTIRWFFATLWNLIFNTSKHPFKEYIYSRDEDTLDWDFIRPLLALINLSLDDELSERATNISSGEAQVINFARALITRPEIIVLDEATAKIDVKTEQVLQKFLDEYLQDKL